MTVDQLIEKLQTVKQTYVMCGNLEVEIEEGTYFQAEVTDVVYDEGKNGIPDAIVIKVRGY